MPALSSGVVSRPARWGEKKRQYKARLFPPRKRKGRARKKSILSVQHPFPETVKRGKKHPCQLGALLQHKLEKGKKEGKEKEKKKRKKKSSPCVLSVTRQGEKKGEEKKEKEKFFSSLHQSRPRSVWREGVKGGKSLLPNAASRSGTVGCKKRKKKRGGKGKRTGRKKKASFWKKKRKPPGPGSGESDTKKKKPSFF